MLDQSINNNNLFQPVVVESLGTVQEATSSFLAEPGHNLGGYRGGSPTAVQA